jgi:NMD protein affecting ribosome stability and mRNA decay
MHSQTLCPSCSKPSDSATWKTWIPGKAKTRGPKDGVEVEDAPGICPECYAAREAEANEPESLRRLRKERDRDGEPEN